MQRLTQDYDTLKKEVRAITPADRASLVKLHRTRLIASAIMFLVVGVLGLYAAFFATMEFKKSSVSNFALVILVLVVAVLVGILALLGFGIYKARRATRASEKTVYMGKITGTGVHGGGSRTSAEFHMVYLENVMFAVSQDEMERMPVGSEAEIHCVIPGEVIDALFRDAAGTWQSVKNSAGQTAGSSSLFDLLKALFRFFF